MAAVRSVCFDAARGKISSFLFTALILSRRVEVNVSSKDSPIIEKLTHGSKENAFPFFLPRNRVNETSNVSSFFPRVIRDRRKRRTGCTGDPRLTGRSRRGAQVGQQQRESRIPRRFISVGGQRCAFLALETWPSGVVDQRICPFVFARPFQRNPSFSTD